MKFNNKAKTIETVNHEGNSAYSLSPKLELIQRVGTWFVNEPKFYGNQDQEFEDIIHLIKQIGKQDPEFILKLATYCREKLLLRSSPIVLLVEASLIDTCKPFVRQYTKHIITRADQLTETIAYLQQRIGHLGDLSDKGSIPAALKKGLADSLLKFNKYQLAKYNRNNTVKLRDVILLTHPKPKYESQSKIFRQILDNTLESPDTWEVIISTKGSTKENWELASQKMGYMALLRNLRNLLEHDVDMTNIIDKLNNKESIIKSKQYPFRFISAYNQVKKIPHFQTRNILHALDNAIQISIESLPRIPGNTAIFADHSYSMEVEISSKSTVSRIETADALLAIADRICDNAFTGVFSDNCEIVNINTRTSILQNMEWLKNSINMGGTSTHKTIETLLRHNLKADRIIILTDEESNGYYSISHLLKLYRSTINPEAKCYIINLAGYGTTEIPESDPKTIHISGFSEKVLEIIPKFEKNKELQLEEIENYGKD